MGLEDRDYIRQPRREGFASRASSYSGVALLIGMNLAVFLLDAIWQIFGTNGQGYVPMVGPVAQFLAVQPSDVFEPWMWWRFVSAGFAHAGLRHLLFNMIGLFIFGRLLEDHYGKTEFLRMYLVGLVLANIIGIAYQMAMAAVAGQPLVSAPGALGASGGVYALMIAAALYAPNLTILVMFIIPMPIWLLATLAVVGDFAGLLNLGGPTNIGHAAHLAGGAYGAAYYLSGWNWGRLTDRLGSSRRRMPSNWRIVRSDDQEDLEAEMDRILAKMKDHGEQSLTNKERKTLERASRKFQQRRGS